MIGYRSIGEKELRFLIRSHNPVYGQSILTDYIGCGCKNSEYGMVSLFKEPYKWKDSRHLFHTVVNISDYAEYGKGIYMASKEFEKTGIWTGRKGNTRYEIDEYYVRYYEPKDIKSIDIGSYFTEYSIKKFLVPFCQKYKIDLMYQTYNANERKFKNIILNYSQED